MYKVVFDADGLIKLAKSGLLDTATKSLKCIISKEVYKEVVEKGKEKLYEDAYTVEAFVHSGEIEAVVTKQVREEGSLSAGELSAVELYKAKKADIIVSDDRRFLHLLQKENIPFVIPTDLMVVLTKIGKVTKEEAINGLNKIRDLVREDAYLAALQSLGGEK